MNSWRSITDLPQCRAHFVSDMPVLVRLMTGMVPFRKGEDYPSYAGGWLLHRFPLASLKPLGLTGVQNSTRPLRLWKSRVRLTVTSLPT